MDADARNVAPSALAVLDVTGFGLRLGPDMSGRAEAYRQRLGALRFDIVICSDRQSLEFLVGNRSALFSGVTGELDFEGTIELAGRLHRRESWPAPCNSGGTPWSRVAV